MKKYTVTLQAEITVSFDENSDEFQELWKQYKEYFDRHANYESFSENLAQFIGRYGTQEFYEGVGFVKLNGENQKIFDRGEYKEQPAIVNIDADTDLNNMIDYEVYYTEEINE